jgi:hypothetical protein
MMLGVLVAKTRCEQIISYRIVRPIYMFDSIME